MVPLSNVNSVAMYEAQLRQKSLSNQAVFCWTLHKGIIRLHTKWLDFAQQQ